MENLFHKINKYSYKLGNSIKDNDIQKIDIYTKHHIHHFEQCGKAIIQSGGNIDTFKEKLDEYIRQVNALFLVYTAKLEALPLLEHNKSQLATARKHIDSGLLKERSSLQEKEEEIRKLQKEVALRNQTLGGGIKNNDKINIDMGTKGIKHNMHYIQQYGKAIIQSGGTIDDLKVSLGGYIATVVQFLEKYNDIIQRYNEITAEIGEFKASTSQQELDEVYGKIKVAQQVIDALKKELTNESIKTFIDRACPTQNMVKAYDDKGGSCYENIKYIREVLLTLGFSREGMTEQQEIPGIFYLIRNNSITEFNEHLLNIVPLQSIGLANIKVILGIMEVQVTINSEIINASNKKFNDVEVLLSQNRDAIDAIANFFYKRKIIPSR